MKEVTREKTMTTKEIAEALGVSKDTIKSCIRRIMPNKMRHGVTTELNEKEVAAISMELKGNSSVLSHVTDEVTSSVANATTELEIMLNAAKVVQQLQDLIRQKELEKEQLQIELDKSKEWFTVKRVLIETGIEYAWAPLRKYSKENGYPIEKVFDKNYGEVNAYHIDVWNKVYGVEL